MKIAAISLLVVSASLAAGFAPSSQNAFGRPRETTVRSSFLCTTVSGIGVAFANDLPDFFALFFFIILGSVYGGRWKQQ